jgi:precorrin-3B C17-methyltransferase
MSKIMITGIGPGLYEHMTVAAINAVESADVVVGFKTYIKIIEPIIKPEQEVFSSGMKKEITRCQRALEFAEEGKNVCLVSSGDAGVYGMAGIMLEIVEEKNSDIEIEIIPGVSAANSGAAVLGAPLMHDYTVISLSDLLTDWEVIEKRLNNAAEGDFNIALYNPKSKGRPYNLTKAKEICLKYKDKDTPVGVVRNAKREGESYYITTLEKMDEGEVDMFSVVIIGNSKTYLSKDKKQMITPRGYKL